MTHEALVGRGATWLQRSRRCEPVLYGLSSGPEIPDVIGWQGAGAGKGSIVLECKASRSDFLRDKHKKHVGRMGDYRFILCPAGMLSIVDVVTHAPEHGLLWATPDSPRIQVVQPAPRRANPNHRAEVRHLRMALVHVAYNIADHGYLVHLPTLTKWQSPHGMKKHTPPAEM